MPDSRCGCLTLLTLARCAQTIAFITSRVKAVGAPHSTPIGILSPSLFTQGQALLGGESLLKGQGVMSLFKSPVKGSVNFIFMDNWSQLYVPVISIKSLKRLFAQPCSSSPPGACSCSPSLVQNLALLKCFLFWGKAFHSPLISLHPLLIGGKLEWVSIGVGTTVRATWKDPGSQLVFRGRSGVKWSSWCVVGRGWAGWLKSACG